MFAREVQQVLRPLDVVAMKQLGSAIRLAERGGEVHDAIDADELRIEGGWRRAPVRRSVRR